MKTVTPKGAILVAAWAISLILVGTYGHSQAPIPRTGQTAVLSGNDVGFQLQRSDGGRAFGNWVVKINGAWVPVGSEASKRPIGQ